MTERHSSVRAPRLEEVTACPPADEEVAVGTTPGTCSSIGTRRPEGD
jgi:hypothetical protein